MRPTILALFLFGSAFLPLHGASGTETFDQLWQRLEAPVRSLCECVMNHAIATGISPIESSMLIDTVNGDAGARCANQAGLTSGTAQAMPLDETARAATTDGARLDSAAWSDEMKAAFVDGCMQGIRRPAYKDYTIRSQIVEGLNLAGAAKIAVARSYAETGRLPADSDTAGLPQSPVTDEAGFVNSIEIAGGAVVVTYGRKAAADIAGRTLTLTPSLTTDKKIFWTCGRAAMPAAADASAIANTSSRVQTTVDNKYLPPSCRQ